MFKSIILLVILSIALIILWWWAFWQHSSNQRNVIKEAIEQQTNNYIFKENTNFTISGAVKIEEIGQMVEVEKLDENLNKTKVKEYEPLMTEWRYGWQVYRVTFKDWTTKRYYWQFSSIWDWEWLPLDFWPYKN